MNESVIEVRIGREVTLDWEQYEAVSRRLWEVAKITGTTVIFRARRELT